MSHVFISYARKDTRYAARLDDDLTGLGFCTWRDTRGIHENDDFTGAIESAIRGASHVVVCLTEDVRLRTNDSFVRREIQYALAIDQARRKENPSRSLPVIPIVFPGGELPVNISTWNKLEVTSDADWLRILPRLSERLAGAAPGEPEKPRYDDPEVVVEYLRVLHERTSAEIEETVHLMLALSAAETQNAVTSRIEVKFSVSRAAASSTASSEVATRPARHFDSFAEALEHHRYRVLLLGAPGAGKTTTLLATARDAAVARLNDSTQPIPILASIRTWDGATPIAAWAAAQVQRVDLSASPIFYLLDGLDELPSMRRSESVQREDRRADFLRALNDQLPRARVVVSARISDYSEIGAKAALGGAVTLDPPSDEQIRDYLTARGCAGLESLLEHDQALREMTKTPLLLALLTVAFAPTTDDSDTVPPGERLDEGHVFDLFIHRRFVHEASRPEPLPFDEATTRDLLADLAIERADLVASDAAAARLAPHREELLHFARRMHFLKDTTSGAVDFIHRTFEDHLALTKLPAILHRVIDDTSALFVCIHLGMMGRRGLVALMDALRTGSVVVRAAAAFQLAHRAPQAFSAVAVGLAVALSDQEKDVRRPAVRCVGQMGVAAVDIFVGLMRDPDPRIHQGAVEGLVLCAEGAAHHLSPVLADDDVAVRLRAIEVLGRLRTPEAAATLVPAVASASEAVRGAALVALGKIGDASMVPRIVEHVRDTDAGVRRSAVQALGALADPTGVPALIVALGDSDTAVREGAADALSRMPSPDATESLLERMTDPEAAVRTAAAIALGKLGGARPVAAILKHFERSDDAARWRIVGSLLSGAHSSCVPLAVAALRDSYGLVRENAVYALRKWHDPTTVSDLLKVLKKDKTDIVRGAAAEALGDHSDPRIVPVLIWALDHSGPAVVPYVAMSLAKIGGEPATRALIAAIRSKKSYWTDAEADDGSRIVPTAMGSAVFAALSLLGTREAREAMQAWPARDE